MLKKKRKFNPRFNNFPKLGNWSSLFSLKPVCLLVPTGRDGQVYDVVNETILKSTQILDQKNAAGKVRFGNATDTNSINNGFTINKSIGSNASAFTFCYYNSNAIDHAIFDMSGQAPVIWADTNSGNLRAALYSGTAVYGVNSYLSNATKIDNEITGLHCWGASIVSNSATSAIYINGKQHVTGNPGPTTPASSFNIWGNISGNTKDADCYAYWTVVFDGALPQSEALRITAKPELMYTIFKPQELRLVVDNVTAEAGNLFVTGAGDGGLAGMGGLAGRSGGLAG